MGSPNEERLRNEEEVGDQNIIPVQLDIEDDSKAFGDYQGSVQEGDVRLLFTNIYGIPATATHPKNSIIREAITKSGASITGLAETNLHWNKVQGTNRWEERSYGWWEDMTSITSNNTLETPNKQYQPGGTMMITRGSIKFRVIGRGVDPSQMGRWSWQLFSGKRGVSTRVITAYRPCKSRGLTSTYMQQRRILDAKKINQCPRTQMLDDLLNAIKAWHESGEQIILMIDLNDDIHDSPAKDQIKSIGLNECIIERHTDLPPIATCNRGNKTIDGIFTSNTIMIQKGGYCPFNTFPSDHRALWIDVRINNLCGSNMSPVLHPQARRLKCNDPKTQGNWTRLYMNALRKHDAIQRAYRLQEQLTQPLSEEHIMEYEKLRQIRKDARSHADKKCRKLRMGGVPYSVELNKARQTIELWKSIISWKRGRKVNSKYIRRLEKKVGLQGSRRVTMNEAKAANALAYTVYWDIKRKAQELRTTFLQRKAKDLARTRKLEENNVYTQLIRCEQQRRSARKIKYVLQKTLGSGVTKISLLNHQGEWEETTDKQRIERGCANENATKYRQTESTPCMTGQLVRELGYLGNTTAAQRILEGTYIPPPGTNRYTTEYFKQLAYDPNAFTDPPTATLPTKEYILGWKKKKEFTSAGKSGWTFSHSKTCALERGPADFEATMAHIPYITGYTPKEWQVGVDIMIYKKINLDRVDKLRTIVLKEADANFNDGRLGKEMMQHAEKHNMIAREQYGSRKGHTSIDHAVNKRLSYDLMRLFRAPGAVCSNDAKSCYDRILHSIVALSMRRLGMPVPPIECMLRCIQNMDHYIRTNHGDSEISYSSKHTLVPFQGVLQGNGAAPSIWVAVSTPLLNMMREANHGMQITTAISNIKSTVVAFAFVDDTDLIEGHMGETDIRADEVMIEMQQAIARWEGGLKTTGGALVPEKSFVYPIDFKFNPAGIVSYKTVREIDAHFEAPNAEGQMNVLRQLEPAEATETLGVFLAPDGNNAAAKEALYQKAKVWSELVKKGHLTAMDVMKAMDSTIIPALQYPLPALTLTEMECKKIMAPILEVTLPHSHICRTYPRAVVYGPKSLMGLGKTDLYVKQGATQIGLVQQYLHTDTITGELLRANVEAIKMFLGTGQNIFTLDYQRFHKLVPPSLMKHVWYFAYKHKIIIQEEVTGNIILRRENDRFIMDVIALQCEDFSTNELAHINRCRMYLQVTTLADITNGNGTMIRQGVQKGQMTSHNQPYYKWPRQTRPGMASWRLWRKALKKCFMREIRLHLKPDMHLGSWTDGEQEGWTWFLLQRTQKLFQRRENRWRVYKRRGRGRMGTHSPFIYMNDALSKPDTTIRCTVYYDTEGQLRVSGTGREGATRDYTTSTEQTITNQNSVHGNIENIIQAIRDGNAKLVSDGSYVKDRSIGSAGWIVEGNEIGNQIRGQQETPGPKNCQCSHRSEMWGILGLVMTVNSLCQTYQITEGTVTAKCDGEGTIKILQWLHGIINNSRKHFDIISALQQAIEASPVTWNFSHLKGHQDKYVSFSQLDRWAQLNVKADILAKQEITRILHNGDRQGDTLPIPFNQCRLYWTDAQDRVEPISSHLSDTLVKLIQTGKIKTYWEKKRKIGQRASESIDWEVLQKSAKNYPRIKWLSKFATGICGVGIMLKLWKHQSHSSCPRCGIAKETTEHVIVCPSPPATTIWQDSINKLKTWMVDNDCEPHMTQIICSSLKAWRNGLQLPYPSTDVPNIVRAAMVEQDNIGWYNFITGFISSKWRVIQQAHLKELGSMKSAILWISRFQKRIWEIPWVLWQHRNEFLHNDGATLHFQETAAINRSIREEYDIGGNNLPATHQHLFHDNVDELLRKNITTKQIWLMSVWSARDHHSPAQNEARDEIAEASYRRWKKRLEKGI
jgi:hypothetical protein